LECVRVLFGVSGTLPVDERFHNLLALAGVVQGGFFLREKATGETVVSGCGDCEAAGELA